MLFWKSIAMCLVVMYFDGSMLWCFSYSRTTWWPSTLWGPLQRSYGGLIFLSFLLPFRFYVLSFVVRVIMKQFGYWLILYSDLVTQLQWSGDSLLPHLRVLTKLRIAQKYRKISCYMCSSGFTLNAKYAYILTSGLLPSTLPRVPVIPGSLFWKNVLVKRLFLCRLHSWDFWVDEHYLGCRLHTGFW